VWRRAPRFRGGIEFEARPIGGLERSDIMKRAARPTTRRAACRRRRRHLIYQRCGSGLERSDIMDGSDNMKWTGEYIIDDAGQYRWHEGLRIHDEQMKSAYRKNSLIEFIIETSAVMGVKVGIA
jgi:hypothetical protein